MTREFKVAEPCPRLPYYDPTDSGLFVVEVDQTVDFIR
jgi:hypothetical protein